MIREAQFILPSECSVHTALQAELLGLFGGFTVQEARGAWRDDVGIVHWDNNYIYTVAADYAVEPPDLELSKLIELRLLVRRYGANANQLSVYFKRPDGVVEFLEPTPDF